jgi:hypothetical protein
MGLDEFIDDLRAYPQRLDEELLKVMRKGGLNIKRDWTKRWQTMRHAHIPHLVKGVGYDEPTADRHVYTVDVGVDPENDQAFLASIIAYGTPHSGPHDAGLPALQAEAPRTEKAALDVVEKLLTGQL